MSKDQLREHQGKTEKGQQQEPKLPLFRVLPPYGYSTPEMDAAINRYLAAKAEK